MRLYIAHVQTFRPSKVDSRALSGQCPAPTFEVLLRPLTEHTCFNIKLQRQIFVWGRWINSGGGAAACFGRGVVDARKSQGKSLTKSVF